MLSEKFLHYEGLKMTELKLGFWFKKGLKDWALNNWGIVTTLVQSWVEEWPINDGVRAKISLMSNVGGLFSGLLTLSLRSLWTIYLIVDSRKGIKGLKALCRGFRENNPIWQDQELLSPTIYAILSIGKHLHVIFLREVGVFAAGKKLHSNSTSRLLTEMHWTT